MKFGEITKFITGVAVPVFALRTDESVGVGEFLDIVKLGLWCKKAGLDMIQILPVNDTGDDTSPYNALSAFALHPIYIRLQEVNGWEEFKDEIAAEKDVLQGYKKIEYKKVMAFKYVILRRIYNNNKFSIKSDPGLINWINDNSSWAKTYCVYKVLKDINEKRSWHEWTYLHDPTHEDINNYWNQNQDEVMFYAWIQYILETQLKKTSETLEDMGLRIKGDIPILINEDSAEVWGNRNYFDPSMRAGAPPDMFSEEGQYWGFPCFKWDVLEADNYSWWRNRLSQASKFYHAYRIDHVLGFFRIWQVAEKETTGTLGIFNPANTIKKEDIKRNVALDDDSVRLLAGQLYTEGTIRQYFGQDADYVFGKYFMSRGNGRFALQDSVTAESLILKLNESDNIKHSLLALYRNKTFIEVSEGNYQPSWFWYRGAYYNSLPEGQRNRIADLIKQNKDSQEELWRVTGLKLLKMMCNTTDMLVCAEDLGAVPRCVPDVLKELKILSLRVERWCREWEKDGQPFINVSEYPRLSVCSPAVHDTSTLRGWWEELSWDKNVYYNNVLKLQGLAPNYLSSELSAAIIRKNLSSNSIIAIFMLQDFLGLYYNLRSDYPNEERVNVPGTLNDENWTYRMKHTIESLIAYDEYNNYVKSLISQRASRPLN
ncbi:MAG: 4-alpha-glucanotransferase [Candidatus Magnetoovum sp. WYHC-5]|nr:4-alpha-glucanotransferase [Candidatus Magnetoovum sp. WYHC-5]